MGALTVAAEGRKADIAKPMKNLGSGVFEVALNYRTDAYRTAERLRLKGSVPFRPLPEKGETGPQDAEEGYRFDPRAA